MFPAGLLLQFTSMICQGVPLRFPNLKLAFLQIGATWLPYYLNRLDEHRERRAEYEMPLLRKKRAILRLSDSTSDLYFDIVPLDSGVIPSNPIGGRGTEGLSSSYIKGCAVPGAGHPFYPQGPLLKAAHRDGYRCHQ
jgi:hypothetical protein